MPDSLFTWQNLSTLAGAAFMCFLIVAYTKSLVDKVLPSLPTDIYATFIGFIILSLAALATNQPITWATFVLALFNGFLVAATAGKLNDKTLAEKEKKEGADGV